jgi:hypothetical protein
MVKILKAVALVGIIGFSKTAAAIVGGILGIVIAPAHNNQAFAQQTGNQTTTAANQTMAAANPDFDARLTGASEVPLFKLLL